MVKPRGSKDLQGLREIIGPSKEFPLSDPPTCRDVMSAGLFLKENSVSDSKHFSISDLSMQLATPVVSFWQNVNPEFQPGTKLIAESSLTKKIERDWSELIDISNNKGKNLNKRKEKFIAKLDKLYNILQCKCNFVSCEDSKCSGDCDQKIHINCLCAREAKIPQLELSFVYDQVTKVGTKGKQQVSTVDKMETERQIKQQQRKEREV